MSLDALSAFHGNGLPCFLALDMSLQMGGENGWEMRKYEGGSSFHWIPRGVAPASCIPSRSQLLSAFESQKPPPASPAQGPAGTAGVRPAIAFVLPLHPAHEF